MFWIVAFLSGNQTTVPMKVVPQHVVPGRIAVVEARSVPPFARLLWQGREIRFFLTGSSYRALIPIPADLKAGQHPIRWKDGETREPAAIVTVLPGQFPTQRIKLPPGRANLYEAPEREEEREIWKAYLSTVTEEALWSEPFLIPVDGRKTTGFGVRRYYEGRSNPFGYHRGLDLSAPKGTAVCAGNSGRVLLAREFTVEGLSVVIDHGQGLLTAYLHLNSRSVEEGEKVRRGQVIGTVGDSGAVTGPHLHWALYVHGIPVDPIPWTDRRWLKEMGLIGR